MSNEKRTGLIKAIVIEARQQQTASDRLDEISTDLLGLGRSEGRCLDIVDQRGRITAGQLAEASGLTPGAITAVVDRLERSGMVRRIRDQEDRRQVFLEVTPRVTKHAREYYGPLAHWGEKTLQRYSEAELTLIHEFLRDGRVFLEVYAAGLGEGATPAAAAAAAGDAVKRGESAAAPAPRRRT